MAVNNKELMMGLVVRGKTAVGGDSELLLAPEYCPRC